MKAEMKRAAIVTNRRRDKRFAKTRKVMEILEKYEIEAFTVDAPGEAPLENCDFIITLGGDGTILAVAERAASLGIPIMGINTGNLGYLTDCAPEHAEEAIFKLTSGDCVTEKRMMLEVTLNGRSERCLNDVCVTRGATAKIIRFDLYINDNYVDGYSADGIIVSTPTGSTAYNLSAGGPILMPDAEMLAITPVCPHTLTARPVVAGSGARIKIVVGEAQNGSVLTMDGRNCVALSKGDTVYVKKAEIHTDIIKTNGLDFYEILRKKLV